MPVPTRCVFSSMVVQLGVLQLDSLASRPGVPALHLDIVEQAAVHLPLRRAQDLRLLAAAQARRHELVQRLLQQPLRRRLGTPERPHIRKLRTYDAYNQSDELRMVCEIVLTNLKGT